jgi:hypothetical protein
MKTPPVYANPLTATYAAFNTLPNADFCQWAFDNADLVEHDLNSEPVHIGAVVNERPFEGTTREIIEGSVGKEYKRNSRITQETLYEKTLKGYERMKSSAHAAVGDKSARVAIDSAAMREKLAPKITPPTPSTNIPGA